MRTENTAFTGVEELFRLGGVLLLASYAIALAKQRVQQERRQFA